jgi:hypothetical protein
MWNAVFSFLCLLSLTASASCFRANQKYRRAIDDALAPPGTVPMLVPERRLSYDAGYLDEFKRMAGLRQTSFGKDALGLYLRPVLLWIDVGFAISLSLALVLFWYLLPWLLPGVRYIAAASTFCLFMGLAYGVTDVAEDLWLARVLGKTSKTRKGEAIVACTLTRLKLATICLSLAGGLVFALYSFAFGRASR